ncbi:MAG: hypothetical protein WBD81_00355 [Collimonas pratensis]|uniref:hypothetical protein n=1 Tax=Collimonas pratensis TaxID=279113 RepID=UPI003C73D79A
MRKLNQVVFIALFNWFAMGCAHSQQQAVGGSGVAAAAPVMYVTDFQSVRENNGSGRRLSHLRETALERSAEKNADALAEAIVRQLSGVGITARYLAPGELLPTQASGWLIGGVFYSRESGGRIQSLLQGSSSGSRPNTAVSVTIANVAGDPNVPFAVIGTEDEIKGQGTVASWNPYVVAAKFVYKKVEGTSGVDGLAKDIADQIVGNMMALQQKNVEAQPH